MRIVIDTDAGVDDAQAIMMALTYPGVTVKAITTLTGNVHVDWVVKNVFAILDVMRADIPVYRGADQPLLPGRWQPETNIHGEDGLGNYASRPRIITASSRTPRRRSRSSAWRTNCLANSRW